MLICGAVKREPIWNNASMVTRWRLSRSKAADDILVEFYCVQSGKNNLIWISKQAQIIGNIHDTLSQYVGQKLRVRANMGRSKIVESEGVLMQVHPQLFIMEVKRKRGASARQSYQYVDVLTGMVELSQDGQPLFGSFIEEEVTEEPVAVEANAEE